jgi:hypothetical protein
VNRAKVHRVPRYIEHDGVDLLLRSRPIVVVGATKLRSNRLQKAAHATGREKPDPVQMHVSIVIRSPQAER